MGKILSNRYEIIKPIGSGAFGQAFLAKDNHLPGKPHCVVKHFKPEVINDKELQIARRLFNFEAEAIYKLGIHPQIPQLFAHFEENQEFYLVQEFIDGQDLSKEIQPDQPLHETYVIDLLKDILEVLAFVHDKNVIHRDIKPENLIRRQDEKIVLIDFGAVKQINTQLGNLPNTGFKTIMIGTLGYMPSEQSNGKPRLSSDIYAVGMIGIQALTGKHPHELSEDSQTGEINWRGYIFCECKLYAKAIASFDKAIKIQPNYAEAWCGQGKVLCELKRYAKAIFSFDEAIQIQPNFAEAWYRRGMALYYLKIYPDAIACYDNAIAIQPDFQLAIEARQEAEKKMKWWKKFL